MFDIIIVTLTVTGFYLHINRIEILLRCDFVFQLLESHEHELQLLGEKLDQEHTRQKLAIRDKIAARKKKKLNELKRKQDMEMTKEWLTQKKELDEVKLAKVRIFL